MTPAALRRKMEDMGMDPDTIDERVDRLADDLVQHDKDESLEEQLAALEAMGYTEDDLERSNPYNQWITS